jgi:NADH-ubiquinone oxidoreductase chain 5
MLFKKTFQNVHESNIFIIFPLFLLALFSIFSGYLTKMIFIDFGGSFYGNSIHILFKNYKLIESEFIPFYIKLIPFFFSIFGIFFAFFFYTYIYNYINFIYNNYFIYNIYLFLNKK